MLSRWASRGWEAGRLATEFLPQNPRDGSTPDAVLDKSAPCPTTCSSTAHGLWCSSGCSLESISLARKAPTERCSPHTINRPAELLLWFSFTGGTGWINLLDFGSDAACSRFALPDRHEQDWEEEFRTAS